MKSERVRVVLSNTVSEDQLTALSDKHDWWIRRRIARNGDQPEEYIYSTDDKRTDLHFIQDHKIGVNYILVQGPDAEEIAPILAKNLLSFDADEIWTAAREVGSSNNYRRALYHLALISMDHGFDREVFEIYEKAMQHSDAIVRGAALLGSAYLGWPELAAPVRRLAGDDEPEESIRQDAALLASRLEKLAAPSA